MSISYRLSPSSTLIFILTLLRCLHFASSQTTTSSGLPSSSSSSSTALPFYNFTYPTFPDQYGSGISASYKDTIDVSWVANGVQDDPVLQIVCWERNDSSSYICVYFSPSTPHSPPPSSSIIPQLSNWLTNIETLPFPDYQHPSSYTHDLSTSSDPSDSYTLALAPYKEYSPCQLRLEDPHQSSEAVTSVAIFISDKTNATTMGVEWNANNPAPKVTVDEGVAIAKTGGARISHRGKEGLMWGLAGAVAAAVVLL